MWKILKKIASKIRPCFHKIKGIKWTWKFIFILCLTGCTPYMSHKRVVIKGEDVRSIYASGNVMVFIDVERRWGW